MLDLRRLQGRFVTGADIKPLLFALHIRQEVLVEFLVDGDKVAKIQRLQEYDAGFVEMVGYRAIEILLRDNDLQSTPLQSMGNAGVEQRLGKFRGDEAVELWLKDHRIVRDEQAGAIGDNRFDVRWIVEVAASPPGGCLDSQLRQHGRAVHEPRAGGPLDVEPCLPDLRVVRQRRSEAVLQR